MACDRYEDALKLMAAGSAPSAEARQLGAPRVGPELETHLAGCAGCREELEALRKALALVDAEVDRLVAVVPSPALAARIRRAAAENAAEPARRPAWLWPALAAAAVLLLAFAVLTRRPVPQSAVATVENRVPHVAPTPESPRPTPFKPASSRFTPSAVATARPSARREVRAEERRRPVAASEPEVIVPPREAEALLRYASSARQRRFTTDSLLVADLQAPLAEPRRVEIRPLEILPLDPDEDSGAR